MVIARPVVITAPEPRGARYGLLDAANGPLPLEGHAATDGVTYMPVSCGTAHSYASDCDHDEKTFDDAPGLVTASPVWIYGSRVCGTAGTTSADTESGAARNLINGEQTQAESNMAALLAAGATPVIPTDTSLTGVVAELERWLYTTSAYGNVGYLHAPVRMAAYAMNESLLIQSGAVFTTPMKTVWVFGGGYPDDDTLYISGQVTVWRSPDVIIVPSDQLIDRTLNQRYGLVERPYAMTYDCLAASATVELTVS